MTDDEKAAAQAAADERYAAVMKAELTAKLESLVPAKVCPPEARDAMADQFLDYLGRVVEFCEKQEHLTVARVAALLYFMTQFTPAHVGQDQASVIEALVQGAKAGARELRREAKPS